MEVYELDETILDYLTKRNLVAQYKKAKEFLKNSQLSSVKFKKRQPKSSGEYYFRINQKYHAIGVFDGEDFIVTKFPITNKIPQFNETPLKMSA